MKKEDELTLEWLNKNWMLLQQSLETLRKSSKKAESIGQKSEYTFEEMESFDSLTSKFSRTSDIFLQKLIRSTWILLHEESMPLIDTLNKAEKLDIINSADELIQIRDLRNQIAHEYIPEAIQELIPDVLELTIILEKNIATCRDFLLSRSWIREDTEI